jgi:hypothetical protein
LIRFTRNRQGQRLRRRRRGPIGVNRCHNGAV